LLNCQEVSDKKVQHAEVITAFTATKNSRKRNKTTKKNPRKMNLDKRPYLTQGRHSLNTRQKANGDGST